jgi:hypothetical protein
MAGNGSLFDLSGRVAVVTGGNRDGSDIVRERVGLQQGLMETCFLFSHARRGMFYA